MTQKKRSEAGSNNGSSKRLFIFNYLNNFQFISITNLATLDSSSEDPSYVYCYLSDTELQQLPLDSNEKLNSNRLTADVRQIQTQLDSTHSQDEQSTHAINKVQHFHKSSEEVRMDKLISKTYNYKQLGFITNNNKWKAIH